MLPHVDNIGHQVLHANNVFIKDILSNPLMNDELKLLDKSTAAFTVLDTNYSFIKNYKQRKINLDNAKKLVERQINEAKKINNWKLKFFVNEKRNLMFDEAWNDIELENFNNALKIGSI